MALKVLKFESNNNHNNNNNKKLKRLKTKAANGLKRHTLKNYNDDNIEGFIKLMNNNQKKKLLIK